MLWKATWHALTRFPIGPFGGGFVLITGDATQRELERQRHGGAEPDLTEVVDYEAAFGVTFRVVDPDGLAGAGG